MKWRYYKDYRETHSDRLYRKCGKRVQCASKAKGKWANPIIKEVGKFWMDHAIPITEEEAFLEMM